MLDLSKFTVKPSTRNRINTAILYGPPGGGKTWLAASVCEMEGINKVLIIDTEGSTFGTLSGFPDEKIDILPIEDIDTFDELLTAITSQEHDYDAVILDTLDVIQGMAVDKFLAEEEAKPNGNSMRAWGQVRTWTLSVIDRLNRAKFVSILVAHQTEEKLDSGKMMTRIALSGSAKEVVAGRADLVGFVTRDSNSDNEEVTTLRVGANSKFATKNRFGLPQEIESPTMSDIHNLINK